MKKTLFALLIGLCLFSFSSKEIAKQETELLPVMEHFSHVQKQDYETVLQLDEQILQLTNVRDSLLLAIPESPSLSFTECYRYNNLLSNGTGGNTGNISELRAETLEANNTATAKPDLAFKNSSNGLTDANEPTRKKQLYKQATQTENFLSGIR